MLNKLTMLMLLNRVGRAFSLIAAFSFFYRFCASYWTCDFLQDRALHTPVLLLLPGHSCLPAGHDGCGHAHLEHFTSPWWLPCTSSYNHQSLTGITFPPTSRQWLCGVALLRLSIHVAFQLGVSSVTLERRRHSCGFTTAGLTCTCKRKTISHNFSHHKQRELFCCLVHKNHRFN